MKNFIFRLLNFDWKMFYRFLIKGNSDSIICLMIVLTEYLNNSDLKQMEDYFKAVKEYRNKYENKN